MEEKVFLDLEGTEYLWSKIQAQDATAIAEHNSSEEAHVDIRERIDELEEYVDGAISIHNTATDSHNDIRLLISGLTTRLNALADSDDITLDQMSEIVAYIKSNKSLIEEVTTNKVNVSDIINNLTTNVENKPLSATQGVAIKALIDALQGEVNTKAEASDLVSHIDNINNPHNVTKAQVGLGNVDNTSDANKTVAKANKLTTPRTIAISGGATGTATFFDGTGNISIPITDIKESYMSWGGKTLTGSMSVFDAVFVNSITNCFAFLPLEGVIAEYTRDNGVTWTTTSVNAGLFLSNSSNSISLNKPYTTNDKIRITIDNSVCHHSCLLKKILIKLYSIGVSVRVIIEYFSDDNLQSTKIENILTGWNSILFSYTFNLTHKLRLTFEITETHEHNNPGFYVNGILGLGEPISGSNMAKTGVLYSYDNSQNAKFPAEVAATVFKEDNQYLSDKYATKTALKSDLYVATTSTTGLMSAADKTKVDKLPSTTASDAGKFLRVSANGAWVAEAIPNAEEVAF